MTKFYAAVAAALTTATAVAGALQISSAAHPLTLTTNVSTQHEIAAPTAKAGLPCHGQVLKTADSDFSEWEQIGTGRFDENFMRFYEDIKEYAENGGADAVEWDGSFTVMRRDYLPDPTFAELRLDHVFNDVSVVFSMNADLHVVGCDPQSIGLKLAGKYGVTDEDIQITFAGTGSSRFYAGSGTFNITDIKFRSKTYSDISGTSYVNFILDGFDPVEFSIEGPEFVSSKDTDATIAINRSSNVHHTRIAIVPDAEFNTITLIYLQQEKPSIGIEYSEHTSGSYSLVCDRPGRYNVVAIPFNADGQCMSDPSCITVYSNRQESHEWTPLGTGRMTDIIGYFGIAGEWRDENNNLYPPQLREVQIDVRADNNAIYRIHNPFGPEYPLYSQLTHTDASDDFYLIVDASDPSRVSVSETLTGFDINSYNYSYPGIIAYLGSHSPEYLGKYAEKRITFPYGSIVVGTSHFYDGYGQNADVEITLPGYIDYSISWEDPSEELNPVLVCSNPDITTVDCALVPQTVCNENRYFPENIYRMVADRADGIAVKTYSVKNGKATISISELEELAAGYGDYTVVAVQRDAAGTAHQGITGRNVNISHPDNKWTRLGTASVELDNATIFELPSNNNATVNCDIYRNNTHQGLFRISSPFIIYQPYFDFTAGTELFIDTTDADKVIFVTGYTREIPDQMGVFTGLTDSHYGQCNILTFANYYLANDREDLATNEAYGKREDNIIDFPKGCLAMGSSIGVLVLPDAVFRITLPELSTVSTPETDTDDAQVEYYNLQGIRVNNPSGGIFIERRGSNIVKRYIP